MDLNAAGKLIVSLGIGLVLLGGLLVLLGQVPGLRNIGRLPGDIHIEGENYSCFFPIVSMIILSILLSLALNILLRLLNR